MEVHNGLTGSISEMVNYSEDGMTKEFDCMWQVALQMLHLEQNQI